MTLDALVLGRYALKHEPTGSVHVFEVVEHAGTRRLAQWTVQGVRRWVAWAELPAIMPALSEQAFEAARDVDIPTRGFVASSVHDALVAI